MNNKINNRLIKILLISLVMILTTSVPSLAEEHGGGEAPKPEGGGHGESAENKGGAAAGPSAQQQYMELIAKLSAGKSKIIAKQDSIKKLIEEKENTKSNSKASEIVDNLVAEYKELTSLIKEYEENRNTLKFRFPEKGSNEIRKYERIESKSLEEIQNQFSLEGRVLKTLKKAKQQYQIKDDENKPNKEAQESIGNLDHDKNGHKGGKDNDNGQPKFNEPIIIKK